MSSRWWQALAAAAVGLVALVVLRYALRIGIDRYLRRLARNHRPDQVASARTRLLVTARVLMAFVALLVIWSVLSIFPSTQTLAHTLLASGAVLAVLVGVAFTTPLSNLGSGLLLAFTQPVRLGDRITVDGETGVADEIGLIHTVLVTDDDRRVFIPNQRMVSSVVVNRTIEDPRRSILIRLPVKHGAPLDQARAAVLGAVASDADTKELEDVSVLVTDVEASLAWLTLTAYARPGTRTGPVAAELRETSLSALQREGFLPG